jgi:hypothetical protein
MMKIKMLNHTYDAMAVDLLNPIVQKKSPRRHMSTIAIANRKLQAYIQ